MENKIYKKFENNTIRFYEELENECNLEKLLNIAKDGIFLYKPLFYYDKIKFHEYAIEISMLSDQYFMIFNKIQYNKFFEIVKKNQNKGNTKHMPFSDIDNLLLNREFLDIIIKETDIYILKYFMYNICHKDLLYCLIKFGIMPNNLYRLIKFEIMPNNLSTFYYDNFAITKFKYNLYDYLYYKKDFSLKKIIKFNINIGYISSHFFRDINVLKLLTKNLNKLYPNNYSYYRNLPTYPLYILNEYDNKIFEPNKLYLQSKDKFFEKLCNLIFNDKELHDIFERKTIILDEFDYSKYGINLKDLKLFKLIKKNNEIDYTDNYNEQKEEEEEKEDYIYIIYDYNNKNISQEANINNNLQQTKEYNVILDEPNIIKIICQNEKILNTVLDDTIFFVKKNNYIYNWGDGYDTYPIFICDNININNKNSLTGKRLYEEFHTEKNLKFYEKYMDIRYINKREEENKIFIKKLNNFNNIYNNKKEIENILKDPGYIINSCQNNYKDLCMEAIFIYYAISLIHNNSGYILINIIVERTNIKYIFDENKLKFIFGIKKPPSYDKYSNCYIDKNKLLYDSIINSQCKILRNYVCYE